MHGTWRDQVRPILLNNWEATYFDFNEEKILNIAKKAKEAGGKVKLSIYEGMFHVFQMAMLLMPESKKAWAEIKRFLHYLDTEENEMQNISKEEKA